jgi:hypothetical protein
MNKLLLLMIVFLLGALINKPLYSSGQSGDGLNSHFDGEREQKKAAKAAGDVMDDIFEEEEAAFDALSLPHLSNEVLTLIVSKIDGRSALAFLGICKDIRSRFYNNLMPRIAFETGVPIKALEHYINLMQPKEISFRNNQIKISPSPISGQIEKIAILCSNMSDQLFDFISKKSYVEALYISDLDISSKKTTLKTIESIGSMVLLKRLSIMGGWLRSLDCFSNLTSLQYLSIRNLTSEDLDISGIKDLPVLVNFITWNVRFIPGHTESIIRYRKCKNLPADDDIRNINALSGHFGWNID